MSYQLNANTPRCFYIYVVQQFEVQGLANFAAFRKSQRRCTMALIPQALECNLGSATLLIRA